MWSARRDEIDNGKHPAESVGIMLAGQRVHTEGQPKARVEVSWRRAADLPEALRSWLHQRALGTMRTWLDWGLITRDEVARVIGIGPDSLGMQPPQRVSVQTMTIGLAVPAPIVPSLPPQPAQRVALPNQPPQHVTVQTKKVSFGDMVARLTARE